MNKRNIFRGLLLVFLIRFATALLPSFQVDMSAWLAWAYRLAELGPANFYSDSIWTQYTPGFLYWLWGIGKLGWVDPLAIKIPVIVADMATGYLIWKVVSKSSLRFANFAFILYVLNPVAILDGSIWGQIDGILTLAMYGSTYLLVEKKNLYLSYVVAAIALLIKPQAIAIVPVLIIVSLVTAGLTKTLKAILLGAMVILAGFYPFYPINPLMGAWKLIQQMGVSYPYTSLFAFNVWSYAGMWKLDSTTWMGMSYFTIGTIMMTVAFVGMILRYRKHFREQSTTYLLFALSCYIFFLFPTRVHERYLFPMFAYLITYVAISGQKVLAILVGLTTAAYTLNLYLPYSYYESVANPLKNVSIENMISLLIPVLASVQIIIFVVLWLFPTRDQLKQHIPVVGRNMKAVEHGAN